MPRGPIAAELIARAQNRDRDAVEQIILRMQGRVKTQAIKFAKSNPSLELDDLIQIGYIAVWKAINRYVPGSSDADFGTYATASVINAFRLEGRKNSERLSREVGTDLEANELAREDDYSLEINLKEVLTRREAQVIAARLLPVTQGRAARGWQAVAKMVKMTVQEAMRVFAEAKKKLRTKLGYD